MLLYSWVSILSPNPSLILVGGCFQLSSVLLDGAGRVKLGDYSLGKRLQDLCDSVQSSRGVHFEDQSLPNLGRGGKKADVYRLVRGTNFVSPLRKYRTVSWLTGLNWHFFLMSLVGEIEGPQTDAKTPAAVPANPRSTEAALLLLSSSSVTFPRHHSVRRGPL